MTTDKEQIIAAVENMLRKRHDNATVRGKHWMREEAAFLAGACTVLQAVFGESEERMTDYVPPAWVLYPMSGRSILER